MSYILLQSTTDSLSIAKNLSKKLVDKKLSPCVHIIHSPNTYYKWEGETISTKEYIILIKTNNINKEKIISLLKKEHNYNNPEILSRSFTIESKDYKKWFDKELNE